MTGTRPRPARPSAGPANRLEVEVRIRAPDRPRAGHPVTIAVAMEDRRADGEFRNPFLDDEIDQALARLEDGRFDTREIRDFGHRLYRALFTGAPGQVLDAVKDEQYTLRIITDDPGIARIPWELLHDPTADTFLALQVPLVRGISLAQPTRPMATDAPVRILVVDSLPRGLPTLAGQVEAGGIREALAPLIEAGNATVTTLSHVTRATLQNALREAAEPIHVLHYIGHAGHDPVTGSSTLLFEDGDGGVEEVEPVVLASLLSGSGVRLVFLNGCQTLQESAATTANTFAPALLRLGIPAVIGMQLTILDEPAIRFAREFYLALADGRSVETAVLDARRLVGSDWQRGFHDLGVPVCYLRSVGQGILSPAPNRPLRLTRRTWRRWVRQRLSLRIVAAALITSIGISSGLLAWAEFIGPRLRPPVAMSGDFNIAIADFDQGEPEAASLARSLDRTLRTEFASLSSTLDVEVRSPNETGPIEGRTDAERAASAARLADRIKADIVVYGGFGPGARSFWPAFFVSGRQLTGAEELTGDHPLGSTLTTSADISTNPAARVLLRKQLTARSKGLAEFTLGLGYYSIKDFPSAMKNFEQALNSGWRDEGAADVLNLFLGNTEAKQHHLDRADDFYRQALSLDPGYARALVGRAEIAFQRIGPHCQDGDVDPGDGQDVIDSYVAAARGSNRPALSDVPAKVRFGLGRTWLCLHRWPEAEQRFREVISEWDGGNRRIAALAAESHAGLALSVVHGDTAIDEADYRRTIREYTLAIQISPDADRRALFQRQRAQLCDRAADANLPSPC
jgi:tetratricopeptide (TPR) repeat protein